MAPRATVAAAVRAIRAATPVLAQSRDYASPAWPDTADPPFVNAAIRIAFGGEPEALIDLLHRIEAAFGRRRGQQNAPRTLDLDLIAFERIVRVGGRLHLPHPRLAERDFVLAPLCDIAPDWTSPTTGLTARQMLAALEKPAAAALAD